MKSSGSRGFTLIEILLVILIISILVTYLTVEGTKYLNRAKVQACQANMLEIYRGLRLWEDRFGNQTKIPVESGVRFFLKLWKTEIFEHSEASAKRFTCPAVAPRDLPGLRGKETEEWFNDWENLDGLYTAYAGRNTETFPGLRWSAKEALVSDDNELGMNHKDQTVVLLGDGTTKIIDVYVLKQDGVLAEEETQLPVGPNSPVELLQQLSVD